MSIAIEPKTRADEERLGAVAGEAGRRRIRPFRVFNDPETKPRRSSRAWANWHLEVLVERLRREFKVDANVGKPQVAYRETLTTSTEVTHRFVRQTGGKGQFAVVEIRIEPRQAGYGFEFVNKVVGGAIPREYIPAVEKGIVEAMKTGVLAGYPMVDVKILFA